MNKEKYKEIRGLIYRSINEGISSIVVNKGDGVDLIIDKLKGLGFLCQFWSDSIAEHEYWLISWTTDLYMEKRYAIYQVDDSGSSPECWYQCSAHDTFETAEKELAKLCFRYQTYKYSILPIYKNKSNWLTE